MVRLWIREDGEQPKAVARNATEAPGPGVLVDVKCYTARRARELYALSLEPEPDHATKRDEWLSWNEARESVRGVTA